MLSGAAPLRKLSPPGSAAVPAAGRRRRGPGALQTAPRWLGSPPPQRWLIGAAGSLLGEAGGVLAGGGWFPPSLAGLIG